MGLHADHVVPMGLLIKQTESAIAGTLSFNGKEIPVTGEFSDGVLKIRANANILSHDATNEAPKKLEFSGKLLEDGTLEGQFPTQRGSLKWTGERLRQRKTRVTSLDGDWAFQTEGEHTMTFDISMKQAGDKVDAVLIAHGQKIALTGTFADGKLNLKGQGEPIGAIEISGSAAADGKLAGAFSSQRGPMRWTATQKAK